MRTTWEPDGVFDPYDLIILVNTPYVNGEDIFASAYPDSFTWIFGFDETLYNPSDGDVYTIQGAPMNGPGDVFTFKIDGVSETQAKETS